MMEPTLRLVLKDIKAHIEGFQVQRGRYQDELAALFEQGPDEKAVLLEFEVLRLSELIRVFEDTARVLVEGRGVKGYVRALNSYQDKGSWLAFDLYCKALAAHYRQHEPASPDPHWQKRVAQKEAYVALNERLSPLREAFNI